MEESIDANRNENVTGRQGGFLQTMQILITWRRFIAINVLILTLVAVIISFILPKWYRATASIMAPKDQSFLNFLGQSSSVLKGLGSLSKLGSTQNTGPYNYFAILKSRRAMDSVVNKFHLMSVYGISDSSRENTIKVLRDNATFTSEDEDYITLEVVDKDPRRAADMANYFIEVLNSISIELGTKEAENNRSFLEMQVRITKDSLRDAEESLRKFQEQSRVIITPEETSALTAIAELYASRAKKELEISILRQHVTDENEALQQLRLEVQELDKRIATFPQTGITALRLYRQLVTQQKILEFLIPMYEQAKINEQKDVPVLLLLDKAVVPEKKIKPQRTLIIAIVFFVSLFSMVGLSLFLHGLRARAPRTDLEKSLRHFSDTLASRYRIAVRE